MAHYEIKNEWVNLSELENILNSNIEVRLSAEAIVEINNCRAYLDEKVANSDQLIYGINTGFGSLCNTAISREDLEKLLKE